MSETEFEVSWSLTLSADDQLDAACQAWEIMRDSCLTDSGATVLVVRDPIRTEGSIDCIVDMEGNVPMVVHRNRWEFRTDEEETQK